MSLRVSVENQPSTSTGSHDSENNSVENDLPDIDPASLFDIGSILSNIKSFSDSEKLNFLKNVWRPPPNYEFPVTTYVSKNNKLRKGSSQEEYLSTFNSCDRYKILVYSAEKDSLPFLLFRNVNVGKEEKLYTEGLNYWPSITKKLKNHFSPSSSGTIGWDKSIRRMFPDYF